MSGSVGNSSSSGFYEPFRKALNRAFGLSPADQLPVTSMLAGAASGAVGGTSNLLAKEVTCSPYNRHSIFGEPSLLDQGADAGTLYI